MPEQLIELDCDAPCVAEVELRGPDFNAVGFESGYGIARQPLGVVSALRAPGAHPNSFVYALAAASASSRMKLIGAALPPRMRSTSRQMSLASGERCIGAGALSEPRPA